MTTSAAASASGGAPLWLAIGTLVLTVAVGVWDAGARRSSSREQALSTENIAALNRQQESLLDAQRQEHERRLRVEEEARDRDREAQSRTAVARLYREPLWVAALDLFRRFRVMSSLEFEEVVLHGGDHERAYLEVDTMYRVGQFFAWVEILRREVQYLEPNDAERERELAAAIDRVQEAFESRQLFAVLDTAGYPSDWSEFVDRIQKEPRLRDEPVLRIFRGEQRAIGELCTRTTSGREGVPARANTIGYVNFSSRLEDDTFSSWFAGLRSDMAELMAGPRDRKTRLLALTASLAQLLSVLDPESQRLCDDERAFPPLLLPG